MPSGSPWHKLGSGPTGAWLLLGPRGGWQVTLRKEGLLGAQGWSTGTFPGCRDPAVLPADPAEGARVPAVTHDRSQDRVFCLGEKQGGTLACNQGMDDIFAFAPGFLEADKLSFPWRGQGRQPSVAGPAGTL